MKKLIQTMLFLSFLPIAAIGQTMHLSGTVMQDNELVANTNVYAVAYTPAFADTMGIAITNTEGIYEMDLTGDENDSLIVWMSTDACPDTVNVVFLAGPINIANLSCDGETNMGELFIGAQSISDDNLEWYFASSITAGVANYVWTIDGQVFTTGTVDYTFPAPGEYEINLSVLKNSGDAYSASLTVSVGNTGSGGGSGNCLALFYPLTDSVEDGSIYFVNSSLGTDLTYLWDFGDGSTSTEAYPTHIFADDEAIYTVCLTIISGNVCEQQYCAEVSGSLDGSGLITNNTKNGQSGLSKSATFEFVVGPVYSGTTGIDDATAPVNIGVYPNPSTGMITLQLNLPQAESGTLNITDITGKIVLQKTIRGMGSENLINLNLESLADGTYLVQYQGNRISEVQKVVLQR